MDRPDWLAAFSFPAMERFTAGLLIAQALLAVVSASVLLFSFLTSGAPRAFDGLLLALLSFCAAICVLASWFGLRMLVKLRRALAAEREHGVALQREVDAHGRADAELQSAMQKAEAANQAKSRYVVGLSHELRTPLNAVMGYAQILERDEGVPENRRGSVQVIRRSAEHLSGLIDGLLDISRIETGRLHVYSNEINIHDFLDQIVDMFRLQARAKGLEFRHVRAKSLPLYVRTDEKRLRQILVNLLSNAIKFTSAGYVRFEIGYRSQVASFVVEDSGSGIPAAELPHIFEPFVRGAAEHNSFTPGLGLGLTITKLLTETLGGEISVSSTPGEGTRFQARLMLAKVERPAAHLSAAREIAGYKGAHRTIMVVDDNLDHRELMREMLEPLGFTVLTAENGAMGLAMLDSVRPDLYFLDIRMPGMSGWELAAALRERDIGAPVIMLSANVGDGAGPASLDAGHSDSLAKPFERGQLLDKIGRHLGLEWIFADDPGGVEAVAPMRNPGPEHLQELASLGQIGHIRGIEAKLVELEADPVNAALVAALRKPLEAYDFEGYAEVLEAIGHEPA